jgi:serine/threonine-protein kinase
MPPLVDDIVAERFRLVRELGRGAMGAVWLAHHQTLNIPCAVKFIAEQGAAVRELRVRFEREARAAAQIRSPHVVQILDHGLWRDQPYIAMEYLEGETLGARLTREGRLSPRLAALVVAQVARGLSKAHALGIVHRDLKPDNLFLVRDDGDVTVKILDFGIAKSSSFTGESSAGTRTGALVGTPCYMSPEQADGTKPIDLRSDLWSLGVIAYRCVVGRLPFESQAIGDLLMKIMHRPIPVPSHAAPDLPEAFDAWWARASERDPDRRFQSAAALADALSEALGLRAPARDEPVSSGPAPSPLARATVALSGASRETPAGAVRADESTIDLSEEPALLPGETSAEHPTISTHPGSGAALEATVALADRAPQGAGDPAGLGTTLRLTSMLAEPALPRPPRARRYGRMAAALSILIVGAAGLLVRWKQGAGPETAALAPLVPSALAPPVAAPALSAEPASTAAPEEAAPGASASATSAAARALAELPSSARPARSARPNAKPTAKPPAFASTSVPSAPALPEKPDLGF